MSIHTRFLAIVGSAMFFCFMLGAFSQVTIDGFKHESFPSLLVRFLVLYGSATLVGQILGAVSRQSPKDINLPTVLVAAFGIAGAYIFGFASQLDWQ